MRHLTSRFGLAALLCGVFFLAARADDTSGGNARVKASEARILTDIKYLASDECEGRGIRTEGINKAADHIANEFKKAGLKPGGTDGWFQPFEVFGRAELETGNTLTVQGPSGEKTDLEVGKDFNVVAFGGNGTASAPLVFVGYGLDTPQQNDYAGVEVAGKIVVVLRGLPEEAKDATPRFPAKERTRLLTLRAKAEAAQKHQAAGILFVNDNVEAAKNEDRLLSLSTTARDRVIGNLPMAHVRRTVVNKLLEGTDLAAVEKAIAGTGAAKSMELKGWTGAITTKIKRTGINVKNVIGIMEGAGPLADEAIVIGAHYDHLGRGESGSLARSKEIHYGADDNASGSTAVMELARRFAAKKDYKGRKLIFMTFSAEESGLLGSAYYCREPVFPLEKTAAMVNLDMVGRLRDKKLILLGAQTAKEFEKIIEESNVPLKLNITATNSYGRYFAASDHYSFFEKQIPVLFLFTDIHPEYHKPTDTWDTINIEGLRECCDLAEGMLDRLCMLTPRPAFVAPPPQAPRAPREGRRNSTVPRLGFVWNYTDDKEGALLEGVRDNSVAAKAGFKAGDRIMEISGKPVKNLEGYMTLMPAYKKGDTIEFVVLRDGKREKIKVTLE
jgi:Zn-dependent M28 family amino/carboxypeptidase